MASKRGSGTPDDVPDHTPDDATVITPSPKSNGGQEQASADDKRARMKELHQLLLQLHKALLDDERREYEKGHGPVQGANQILQLLMHDPWFDWLRQISKRIIQIDELLEANDFPESAVREYLLSLHALFRAAEADSEFMAKYKAALRREPSAVLAHIKLQKHLLSVAPRPEAEERD